MHLVRAFLDACTAKRTAVAVSLYIKFGNGKIHYLSPSLANGINIGVPPSTAAIFSGSGQIMRIADSSDAKYVLLPFSAVISERSLSLSLRASKPCFEPTNIENGVYLLLFLGHTVYNIPFGCRQYLRRRIKS